MTDNYYRKIFVCEPSHEFDGLKKYTDQIEFIATGYEDTFALSEKISSVMKNYDPTTDAIVPVGRLMLTFLLGIYLAKQYPGEAITVGLYKDKDYTFAETIL